MRLCIAILGVSALVGCGATEEGQDRELTPALARDVESMIEEDQETSTALTSNAESLVDAVEQLHSGMKAPSKAEKVAAMKKMLPAEADLEALFPGHGERTWGMVQPHLDQMIEHIDEVASELTQHEWSDIEAIDVRQEDTGGYADVLEIIPKETPVFRIIKRSEKFTSWSSSYVFINGHWVHIQGFERIPEAIAGSGGG